VEVRALRIAGAFEFIPVVHADERGAFLEQYRVEPLAAALAGSGASVPPWVQTNVSISRRGVVRGIHYSVADPGQAKYVTVVHGSAVDYVVDLRAGSPTFGEWERLELDAVARRAVYIPAGLGHAFAALEDETVLHYLCSAVYDPASELSISPLDPAIALDLPFAPEEIVVSPRDGDAPTLAEADAAGRLVVWR